MTRTATASEAGLEGHFLTEPGSWPRDAGEKLPQGYVCWARCERTFGVSDWTVRLDRQSFGLIVLIAEVEFVRIPIPPPG